MVARVTASNLALEHQAEMSRVESLDTTNHGHTIVNVVECHLTKFQSRV